MKLIFLNLLKGVNMAEFDFDDVEFDMSGLDGHQGPAKVKGDNFFIEH